MPTPMIAPTPGALERRAAYVCASAAMFAIVPMIVLAVDAQVLEDFLGVASLALYSAAVVANVGLLARNRARRLGPDVRNNFV